jgi:hypothetical protein
MTTVTLSLSRGFYFPCSGQGSSDDAICYKYVRWFRAVRGPDPKKIRVTYSPKKFRGSRPVYFEKGIGGWEIGEWPGGRTVLYPIDDVLSRLFPGRLSATLYVRICKA